MKILKIETCTFDLEKAATFKNISKTKFLVKGKPMEITYQTIENNIIYFELKAYEGVRFDLDLNSNSFDSDIHLKGLCTEM